MRMNRIKKRRLIVILILLFMLGVGLFSFGFKECDQIIYAYTENNNVDYKVYLKPNNFFDMPYLEKDKTYITSLINYIDADFAYKINFNEKVSGNLKYKMYAQVKADKVNNDVGNYLTKEYSLTDELTSTINSNYSHEIKSKQKIEYNKYNDLLNSFIKEYSIQTDATVRVYMKVFGKVKVDNTEEEMNINSEVSLIIPLSKLAVEGKIETQSNNKQDEIVRKVQDLDPYRKLAKVGFVVVVAAFVYYLFKYVVFLVNRNKYLIYTDKIKKINTDYAEIITKVKSLNVKKFAVIDVESFEDLISVYKSVREPINFLYEAKESKYFIIKETTCYMYTIYKEEVVDDDEEN